MTLAELWKSASDGQPLHAPTVNGSFRAALAYARLPGIRFHSLRHTAASLLAQGAQRRVAF